MKQKVSGSRCCSDRDGNRRVRPDAGSALHLNIDGFVAAIVLGLVVVIAAAVGGGVNPKRDGDDPILFVAPAALGGSRARLLRR